MKSPEAVVKEKTTKIKKSQSPEVKKSTKKSVSPEKKKTTIKSKSPEKTVRNLIYNHTQYLSF